MSPLACFNVYVAQGMCVSPFACIKAYGAQDLSRHFVDKISLCTLWYIDSCELSTWSVRHLPLHLAFFSPEPRDSLFCTTKAVPLVLLASVQVALEVTKFSESIGRVIRGML